MDAIGEFEKLKQKDAKVNVVATPQRANSQGAAATPIRQPTAKTYEVQIKNMQFVPSHLRIEKGSTVTWKVCPDTTYSAFSSSSTRSHILSFNELFVESPKLELGNRLNDTFSLNFQDFGTYTYGCCIYSRMHGSIEVIDSERPTPMFPWQKMPLDCRRGNPKPSVFDYAASPRNALNQEELNSRLIQVLVEAKEAQKGDTLMASSDDDEVYGGEKSKIGLGS